MNNQLLSSHNVQRILRLETLLLLLLLLVKMTWPGLFPVVSQLSQQLLHLVTITQLNFMLVFVIHCVKEKEDLVAMNEEKVAKTQR